MMKLHKNAKLALNAALVLGLSGCIIVGHFDESIAFRLSSKFVHNNFYRRYFAKFFKSVSKIRLLCVEV